MTILLPRRRCAVRLRSFIRFIDPKKIANAIIMHYVYIHTLISLNDCIIQNQYDCVDLELFSFSPLCHYILTTAIQAANELTQYPQIFPEKLCVDIG